MTPERPRLQQTTELLLLGFSLLLVLLIGTLAFNAGATFRRSSAQAELTRQVVEHTNTLLSLLKDAETGQRGFLLTGEERYLEPYRQALAAIPPTLDALTAESDAGQAGELERTERLRPLVKAKLDELQQTVELRRSQGMAQALAIVRTDRGKAAMDQIRSVCGEIEVATYDRERRLIEEARTTGNQTALIAVIGSVAIFTFLVFATATIHKIARRRLELIGALKKSEAEATRSRDWLHTTLASIGDAVITTDAAGRVTLLNGVAQSLTGWKQDEAAGTPLDRVFVIRNAETNSIVENPVTKVLREGQIVGLANHTRLIAKDGRPIPIDDSAAPIRNEQGEIAGVVLVFRDITAREESEKALEKSMVELRSSNAALSRANEDLNQFAFAASHDLQEPLRMITSYSQLLVKGYRGQLDGEAATCIEFITDGARRMRDLLSDLLEYAQLGEGGREGARSLVDLNIVLRKTLENCGAAIAENQAAIISDPLPAVDGNEAQFIQVFQNLITNAIKYRSTKPPRIRVSAVAQDGMWRFGVADNGIGIAAEYHQQIFGVFKRLHGRNIPGTGIGLAICQRVVERHGGRIWVESQAGEGATLYFTVPANHGAALAHGS